MSIVVTREVPALRDAALVDQTPVRRPGARTPGLPVTTTTTRGTRTINVGILGLGNVGQAVARLAAENARLRDAGLRVRIESALVREIGAPRRCVKPKRLTTNADAFLRGTYDVVVEALGTVEPARTIVARLLGRGVAVVTANKALVAAHGARLTTLAARRGTTFRYEASALAGIPFLGTLAARPLVSDVDRFTAVVNGTSNFILSVLESDGCSFDEALGKARALGLTEPDPSRDLDGLDAADKLSLLATLFGWGSAPSAALDVHGIRDITPADLHAARRFGATIKPVVQATRTAHGIEAFVGPALVPERHPLAALRGTLSGIQLSGRFVSDLFFSGPGAGPDITAATILDDVVEAVSTTRGRSYRGVARPSAATPTAPATGWFIRARFPGVVPDESATRAAFAAHGLTVLHVSDAADNARWLQVDVSSRVAVSSALTRLQQTHRVQSMGLRAL